MAVLEAEHGTAPDLSVSSASGRSLPRVLARTGWVLLLAPFVFEALAILRASHLSLVRRLPDDAFYYLEIAARLGRGEGFTFDGVHETNGFHIVWQALLVPLSWFFTGDSLVRASLLLGLVVTLAAVLLVVAVVRRWVGDGPALVGGICAVQFSLGEWTNGMEAPAVLLGVALVLWTLTRAGQDPTQRRVALVGVASAFLVLCRFDYVAVIWIVPLALLVRLRHRRVVVAWFGGLVALAAPIGVWWLARWGHVLTTSATVKRAELDRSIDDQFGGRLSTGYMDFVGEVASGYVRRLGIWRLRDRLPYGAGDESQLVGLARVLGLVGLATASLGWIVAIRRWSRGTERRLSPTAWAIALVLGMLAAKAVLDVVTAPLWAAAWYSAAQRLAIGFVFGAGIWIEIRYLIGRWRIAAISLAVALAAFLIPINLTSWNNVDATQHGAGWQDQIDLAANWISAQGPDGRYGARDAGLLAYRLDGERTVVNLDGLVNDYDFAERVANNERLRKRAAATGVEYFVGRLSSDDVAREFGCGTEVWRGPELIYYSDSLSGPSREPLRILDLRSCS